MSRPADELVFMAALLFLGIGGSILLYATSKASRGCPTRTNVAAPISGKPSAVPSEVLTVPSEPSRLIVTDSDLVSPPSKIYPHAPVGLEKVIERDSVRVTAEADVGGYHVMCLVGPMEGGEYAGEAWTKCGPRTCRWLVTAADIKNAGIEFGWCERRPR